MCHAQEPARLSGEGLKAASLGEASLPMTRPHAARSVRVGRGIQRYVNVPCRSFSSFEHNSPYARRYGYPAAAGATGRPQSAIDAPAPYGDTANDDVAAPARRAGDQTSPRQHDTAE